MNLLHGPRMRCFLLSEVPLHRGPSHIRIHTAPRFVLCSYDYPYHRIPGWCVTLFANKRCTRPVRMCFLPAQPTKPHVGMGPLQGFLAHQKTHPPRTLPCAYA